MGQQGFQFASKNQAILGLGIEQWLDAAAVAGQKERTCVYPPDCEGKNTVAPFHAIRAPFGKSVEQNFRVRMAGEAMAAVCQRGTQL